MLWRIVATEARHQWSKASAKPLQTTIVKFIVEYTVVCLLPTIFIVDDLQFKYF